MKVLIAGAGIAGLTTALSLHARGIEAQVIDSVRQLRPLGVGINLLPHAVAELAELGLADALAATAIPTAAAVHYDRFGNEIWRESRGLAAGHEWPQYSIHRGELHTILLRAVRDRLGAGAVREGLRLTTIVERAEQVHCRIRDRATDSLIDWNADVLIGADGLHSVVRAHLHPEEGGPRWNGIQMWRGTAERAPFLDGRTMILAGSSTAARFVAYPISRAAQQRGRSLVNWVAEVRVHEGAVADPDWNRIGRIDDVLPHYAGWRIAGVDIAELIAASGEILEYPMVDRDPLPHWGSGRVTLVGDAAHPMYPVGSNGGSQAIVGARALAAALAESADPVAGPARYQRARREHANAIVLANRDIPMDRIIALVTERAPNGFARIEQVLTADELSAIDAAYRRTSGALSAPAEN
ncbi:flavin-dependent oxidoreductase [Nocardia cyriacigeorgica]|uniref:flavin-dependent oxidoreductase n=1 Tax=Nocardia cyriacigeorgica TaxID=135487 RepID=UPI0018949177|nr:flavin-dependent oxidoreductase [Nocardia cyriacigeorgica]MBF6438580.1 flavin-dependent oxidoreductase [Nocardia cyriacigeorgica]MBF6456487.1 flavin-dependent oxidoreductase [Nocardia cyriacigeorgica]MBF6476837.1 flavin-dependent oxidoreductase [Nocardia cyriacigeorgica]MBF6551293.1 flavin-dependent oxidoreductase [Nocardia cyriacigeorgica]